MHTRIGVISSSTDRKDQAAKVNTIITDYGDMIIGRMGIPYEPKGIHIISLIVHGTTDMIGAMTGRLGSLEDVGVKAALTNA